jgi:hypothetical protein
MDCLEQILKKLSLSELVFGLFCGYYLKPKQHITMISIDVNLTLFLKERGINGFT